MEGAGEFDVHYHRLSGDAGGQIEAEKELRVRLPYPHPRQSFIIDADLNRQRTRFQDGGRAVTFQVQLFTGSARPTQRDRGAFRHPAEASLARIPSGAELGSIGIAADLNA